MDKLTLNLDQTRDCLDFVAIATFITKMGILKEDPGMPVKFIDETLLVKPTENFFQLTD